MCKIVSKSINWFFFHMDEEEFVSRQNSNITESLVIAAIGKKSYFVVQFLSLATVYCQMRYGEETVGQTVWSKKNI